MVVQVLRQLKCLKMEGILKPNTPNKLASKLKLHLNRKMHLPTLICGVSTTDTVSSQASSALVLRVK